MISKQQQFLDYINAVDTERRNYRYIYFANETDEWYSITKKDIEYGVHCMNDQSLNSWYSHWCAGTSVRVVPDKTLRKLKKQGWVNV